MVISSIVIGLLAQAAAVPATTTAVDRDDEIVCRRLDVTGSIARKERVCRKRGEWRRLADAGNDVAREITDWGRGRPSGN